MVIFMSVKPTSGSGGAGPANPHLEEDAYEDRAPLRSLVHLFPPHKKGPPASTPKGKGKKSSLARRLSRRRSERKLRLPPSLNFRKITGTSPDFDPSIGKLLDEKLGPLRTCEVSPLLRQMPLASPPVMG